MHSINFTAIGVAALFIFTNSAYGQIKNSEKSPQVPDILHAVKQLENKDTLDWVNATVEGFTETYTNNGAAFETNDHVNGITISPLGRVGVSIARRGPLATDSSCTGGLMMISSPYENGNGDDLTWTFLCGLNGHPSSMQAVGEIFAVSDRWDGVVTNSAGQSFPVGKVGARFFQLKGDGQNNSSSAAGNIEELTSLRLEGGGEAVGVTYNAKHNRFYAFASDGGVAPTDPSATQTINLCATQPGSSLHNEKTSFNDCVDISGVAISGQGAHLLTQSDGKMFVVSTFSSTSEPADVDDTYWGLYVAECAVETIGAGIATFVHEADAPTLRYNDVIVVTEIDMASKKGIQRYTKNLARVTPTEPCVHLRPAYRFAGAVAPYGNDGALMGLWGGRFMIPQEAIKDDDFEFAAQKLNAPIKSSATADGKAYLFRENDSYHRYTSDVGVDDGYPLPTNSNWSTGGKTLLGATRWDNGHVYLFLEGGYYSRLEKDGSNSPGYPKKITNAVWPGLEEHAEDIKAVVNWGNGKVYFFLDPGPFSDGTYIRYDIKENKVDQAPLGVGLNWGILGDYDDDISAAVNWGNGVAYFFIEGGGYVRWDIIANKAQHYGSRSGWKGVGDSVDIIAAFRHR